MTVPEKEKMRDLETENAQLRVWNGWAESRIKELESVVVSSEQTIQQLMSDDKTDLTTAEEERRLREEVTA